MNFIVNCTKESGIPHKLKTTRYLYVQTVMASFIVKNIKKISPPATLLSFLRLLRTILLRTPT